MKTLIIAKHFHGPHENGYDGCYARIGYKGMCPGVELAEWLNKLPDDEEIFLPRGSGGFPVTCGQVRANWLQTSGHIIPKDKEQAELSAEKARLSAALRVVNKRIKELAARTAARTLARLDEEAR